MKNRDWIALYFFVNYFFRYFVSIFNILVFSSRCVIFFYSAEGIYLISCFRCNDFSSIYLYVVFSLLVQSS